MHNLHANLRVVDVFAGQWALGDDAVFALPPIVSHYELPCRGSEH